MADDAAPRPKRRCARTHAPSSMPSAVHYVGYVEDEETPEMIMAKFMELERIQGGVAVAPSDVAEAVATADDAVAAPPTSDSGEPWAAAEEAEAAPAAAGGAQELTDEQLLRVFKQTSMFNVRTAMHDNAMLVDIDDALGYARDRYGSDDELSDDDDGFLHAFWSDEDWGSGAEGSDDGDEEARARRRGPGGGRRSAAGFGGGVRAQRGAGAGAPRAARHAVVTAYNPDTQALVRRRVRVADPDEVVYLRVPPPPLPPAWGRAVRPYAPPESRGLVGLAAASSSAQAQAADPPTSAARSSSASPAPPAAAYLETTSVPQADFGSLLPRGRAFQAVMINPGWARGGGGDGAVIDPGWSRGGGGDGALAVLSALPLPRLVPSGFVFIWTPKQLVHAVCKQMGAWGYSYIENLTWVWLGPNAAVTRLPSRYIRSSHLTLYMFRAAGKGRDIELRHQRNPDVAFDCLAWADGQPMAVPEAAFAMVETLLPTGAGTFLELWAARGARRPGWAHVAEAPAPQAA